MENIDNPTGTSPSGIKEGQMYKEWFNPPKEWYTSPKETMIGSIPAVIVDPHNEVFPYWLQVKNGPALLLHIDKHPDDTAGAPAFEEVKNGPNWSKEQIAKAIVYSKNKLGNARFICPAMNKGAIDRFYWINPRKDYFHLYEKLNNETLTKGDSTFWGDGHWKYPESDGRGWRSLSDVAAEVKISNLPVILDIDLDSFLDQRDSFDKYDQIYKNPDKPFDVIDSRLRKIKTFLKQSGKKPALITIARSQTPETYTPHDKVDEIQRLTIEMLKKVYS